MIEAQFPKEYSLGELTVYKNAIGDPRLIEASGSVQLSEDDWVILSVNQETCSNMQRLRGVPPNAIHGVAFMNLDLSTCDLSMLSTTPPLEFVGIVRGNLTSNHKQKLSFLTQIKILDLTGTKNLGSLDWLREMRNLERLLLSFADIGDEELISLPKIQPTSVSLLGTQVSDKSVARLAAINSLTYLELTLTKVTEQGRKTLGELLPNCHIRFDSTAALGTH